MIVHYNDTNKKGVHKVFILKYKLEQSGCTKAATNAQSRIIRSLIQRVKLWRGIVFTTTNQGMGIPMRSLYESPRVTDSDTWDPPAHNYSMFVVVVAVAIN